MSVCRWCCSCSASSLVTLPRDDGLRRVRAGHHSKLCACHHTAPTGHSPQSTLHLSLTLSHRCVHCRPSTPSSASPSHCRIASPLQPHSRTPTDTASHSHRASARRGLRSVFRAALCVRRLLLACVVQCGWWCAGAVQRRCLPPPLSPPPPPPLPFPHPQAAATTWCCSTSRAPPPPLRTCTGSCSPTRCSTSTRTSQPRTTRRRRRAPFDNSSTKHRWRRRQKSDTQTPHHLAPPTPRTPPPSPHPI